VAASLPASKPFLLVVVEAAEVLLVLLPPPAGLEAAFLSEARHENVDVCALLHAWCKMREEQPSREKGTIVLR
jgi:hypothetical protein